MAVWSTSENEVLFAQKQLVSADKKSVWNVVAFTMDGWDVRMSVMMNSMHGQDKTEISNPVQSVKLRLGSTMAVTTWLAKNAITNGVGFALENTEAVVAILAAPLLVQEASLDLQILVLLFSS